MNRGLTDTPHQNTAKFRYVLTDAASLTFGFKHSPWSSSSAIRDFFNTNTSLEIQYRF